MNVHTRIYKQQKRAIRESGNSVRSKCFINLSPGQLEIFNRALHELAEAGNDTLGRRYGLTLRLATAQATHAGMHCLRTRVLSHLVTADAFGRSTS